MAVCLHQNLLLTCSTHASAAGYKRPTSGQQRQAAVLPTTSRTQVKDVPDAMSFPAPLILPDDDLALDPKCPPQSLRQWIRLKERNHVTPERNNVYVASSPAIIDSDVKFMQTWTLPNSSKITVQQPKAIDVVEYLSAYYHGIPVKILPPSTLTFVRWESNTATSSKSAKMKASEISSRYVGLNTTTECIRIRTRASKDHLFKRQLNLDDLLDAAISILPDDAYALIMLVDHDLYESADDEFVCGRAYGGSRVAVISLARYNPTLDSIQGIERTHGWPASHCEVYVKSCCESSTSQPAKKKVKKSNNTNAQPETSASTSDETQSHGALHAALAAHRSLPPFTALTPNSVLHGLWLGRVCRTAAHELGHCFGMDHCIYYACSMQGSASLKEDARQPPYLCPVDLAKMLSATGADPIARYEAIITFCLKHTGVHLFDSFRAWLVQRLQHLSE